MKQSVPMRQGTPATQMLSLMQSVLFLSKEDAGDLWARLKRYAHALSRLSDFDGRYLNGVSIEIE